jgi:ABC-type Mn2+/Zn2+ transport system ATPase subunit
MNVSGPSKPADLSEETLDGNPPARGPVQDVKRPAGPAVPIIGLEQLRLAYGGRVVLDRVNFNIHEGEFWCFLGSNGQGKTTLIKALLGALAPKYGLIKPREDVFAKRKVSYVPQRLELNPVLPTSVAEFITSGLVGIKTHSEQRRKRLERVLELMGLKGSHDRNLWTLSGGQRQRALVARALIRDPSLLIVDEPTAGLDLTAAQSVLKVLRDLNSTYKVTIVFVTHELQIAADYGSHIALFRDGQVTAGPKAQVMTSENMQKTFGVPIKVNDHGNGKLEVVTDPEAVGGQSPASSVLRPASNTQSAESKNQIAELPEKKAESGGAA